MVALNASVREFDEWFDEPDELDRVVRILTFLSSENDPIKSAALAASRISRSQAFTEGNKRTALLVAKWILDRNGLSGSQFIPSADRRFADLLLRSARGENLDHEFLLLLDSRR